MVGGVICGYWAMASVTTATPPARVMRMDSTAAKIGRSMKNRENTTLAPGARARLFFGCGIGLGGEGRAGGSTVGGHLGHLGLHLGPGADALQSADDHLIARLQ